MSIRGFKIQNGDLVLDESGYFVTVSSADKVKRDLHKRLSTDSYWGSNDTSYFRYNKDYGVDLNNNLIYQNQSGTNLLNVVNSSVQKALSAMVSSQKADANIPFDEIIDKFDYYSYFDSTDASIIKCRIKVSLLNGTTLDLGTFSQNTKTATYKLPGVSFDSVTE